MIEQFTSIRAKTQAHTYTSTQCKIHLCRPEGTGKQCSCVHRMSIHDKTHRTSFQHVLPQLSMNSDCMSHINVSIISGMISCLWAAPKNRFSTTHLAPELCVRCGGVFSSKCSTLGIRMSLMMLMRRVHALNHSRERTISRPVHIRAHSWARRSLLGHILVGIQNQGQKCLPRVSPAPFSSHQAPSEGPVTQIPVTIMMVTRWSPQEFETRTRFVF